MSEPPQPPIWLRRQKQKLWARSLLSVLFVLRLLEIGRAAVAEPFEILLEYGVILWTIWGWYSYIQDVRAWREMLADRSDDLRQ
jgi:hypothetical protein